MGRGTSRRGRAATSVALIVSFVIVASACGGKSSSSGGDGSSATSASPNTTLAVDGPPRSGGSLVFGLDAETDGWDPTKNRFTAGSYLVALSIFDPLAAYDADGNPKPYLAESFTPNSDFTQWTVKLRPGVTFQDGTQLTSDALVKTYEGYKTSTLAAAIADLDHVETPDPQTALFVMKRPWSSFPVALTGQLGLIPAPSQVADPDGSRKPVGTGPFSFVSWAPDKNLVVQRNPDYWRTDQNGTRLPYLDRVEFRPIPDNSVRVDALASGDIDRMFSTDISAILRLKDLAAQGKIQLVQNQGQTEASFVMLNMAKAPFDDPRAREAIATATDRNSWVQVIAQGQTQPSTGIWKQGTTFYTDAPFPAYDLDKAKQLVSAYEADKGPLKITLSALPTPAGTQQAQFLKEMWSQAGIDVDIKQSEATKYLVDSVLGDYQAVIWGQFGSPDPDYEQVWWLSSSVAPLGSLSLNFPRNSDPQIDEALRQARATQDLAQRKQAYATVQQRLNADMPYIWLDHVVSVTAASNKVRGITNGPLPDGSPAYPMGGPGSFSMTTFLTQTWLTGGS